MTPSVRIVIVTYNSEHDISECLGSVKRQGHTPKEIIVIDNASKDRTVCEVTAKYPDVEIVRNSRNLGYAGGNNLGLCEPLPDYVVFLNPDTSSDEQWLSALVSDAEAHPEAGAVQASIMLSDKRFRLNSRGNEANILFFGWPEGYGERGSDRSKDSAKRISFPSGCAVLFRREVLQKTKGFDSTYFMYGEDLDLGLRTFILGWEVLCSPSATIYHKYEYHESAAKFFLLERNRLMTLFKVYHIKTILFLLPLLLASETGVILRASSQGWLGEKLRSYGAVMIRLRYLRFTHAEVQRTRVKSDRDLVSTLKGSMTFEPLMKSSILPIGNFVLERYRRFLLGLRL